MTLEGGLKPSISSLIPSGELWCCSTLYSVKDEKGRFVFTNSATLLVQKFKTLISPYLVMVIVNILVSNSTLIWLHLYDTPFGVAFIFQIWRVYFKTYGKMVLAFESQLETLLKEHGEPYQTIEMCGANTHHLSFLIGEPILLLINGQFLKHYFE